MKALHIDLKLVAENFVELRYFIDNPNEYQPRRFSLLEIADLIKLAERDYYVSAFAEDYIVTGRRLYQWLDGSDRTLQPLLDKYRREGIVLAISATEKLAHLPWEVLHDGVSFLVQRGVVPVRWVADSSVRKLTIDGEPENRALQVLFMATSPLNVSPVLDFEGEEARILAATARQPLTLTVEESGCLSELGYLVDSYGKDYFDVLHLTGHATLQDGQPRFITETPTGEAEYASAADIAQELQFRLPKLIFLSGCHTGQAGKAGSVPSMAEELLKAGAKAVLGWGQSVLETDATEAAATLYGELSAGKQITEAVASTYQTLIKNKARDWHLLRLYAAGELPSALVTPLRTRGRKPAPPLSVATEFLDAAGKVKVPTRESFVGRRRQLQNCLRVLTQPSDEIVVLIHGMGGLGKSSLAARLCDRLPSFERVVWVGRIDEGSLVSRLSEKLDNNEQRKSLQNYDEELKFRLRRVLQQLHEESKPFLLVLDDFEWNLETSPLTPLRSGEGSPVPPFPSREGELGGLGRLQPEAAEVLKALVWAIRENYTFHRIIITCRYDFEFSQLQYFHKQPLDALHGADLRKKFNRLEAFSDESKVDEALKSQAQKLADGNPRLLEWLDKILQNTTVDQAAILNRLAADSADRVELRSQVLAEALLQQMDKTMREMLSRGLVFELPVPREAFAVVCQDIANLEDYINRAVALGLLEVSHDEALRVPRILPVQLPEDGEALCKRAAEVLYRLWWKGTKTSAENQNQLLEIHRLALRGNLGKIVVEIAGILASYWNSQSRFREAAQLCQSTLEIAENYLVLHQLAYSEQELGEVSKAQEHYLQALDRCHKKDKKEKATILHDLGNLKVNIGEVNNAIALFKKSLAISEQISDVQGKRENLTQLAILKIHIGETSEALNFFEKLFALNERIFDSTATANNSTDLKINKVEIIEKHIKSLEKLLLLTEQIRDIRTKALVLRCLASFKADTGEINEAIALCKQSLFLTEQIGNILGQAESLHQLGKLKVYNGAIDEAVTFFEQSLALTEQIYNVKTKAEVLYSLGRLKFDNKDFNQAIIFFEKSLPLIEQIRDVRTQTAILHYLGMSKAKTRKIKEATALFQQSFAISKQINNIEGQAVSLFWLGTIAELQGNYNQALDYLQPALEILQRIQSPDAERLAQWVEQVKKLTLNS